MKIDENYIYFLHWISGRRGMAFPIYPTVEFRGSYRFLSRIKGFGHIEWACKRKAL